MALRWFATRQSGAVLPQARQAPELYFRFNSGVGGAGGFYRKAPGSGLQLIQNGRVPIGNGLTSYKAAGLPDSQSGLPLRFVQGTPWDLLDFVSIGRTPQTAQDLPSIVRTTGARVLSVNPLNAAFGTVAYLSPAQGAEGYLMAAGSAGTATDGTAIPAGINFLPIGNIGNQPLTFPESSEFVPVTNYYAYAADEKIVPLHAVLVKDTYYLVERDDAASVPKYYLSRFVISTKTYTRGPVLPVTPLGINYSESEDPGFLVLLAFAAAGAYDNLYQVDPTTGVVSLLVPVAVNDPLNPFKRSGIFFLGHDPSSMLDQFAVLDTAYRGLVDPLLNAEGNYFARRSLANPAAYYTLTAERAFTQRSGPTSPEEIPLPEVLPGDPPPLEFPRRLFPPPAAGVRDFPTQVSKWVPYYGPFTAATFNGWMNILAGGNGRIRGLKPIPNAGNTQVSIEIGDLGGAFICNGVGVYYPSDSSLDPIAITGGPPYALTAYTAGPDDVSSIDFAIEAYNPTALAGKAILAYTDSSGFNWAQTPALGLTELAALAATKQLTDEELALLTAQDGTINVADALHRHRVAVPKDAFERIFNYDYDKVPHVPKATPPEFADQHHGHEGSMTDAELETLTSRTGVKSADSQHGHATLPTAVEHAAVFGGPNADASAMHTHLGLLQMHGVIANPIATRYWVPQNIGTGDGFLNASESTFSGSLSLILGESFTGSGVNRVTGIRYKEFAAFMHSTRTVAIGGGTAGLPASEVTELFGPNNPSNVLAPVEFGEIFTWRGIAIRVVIPDTGAVPLGLPTTNRPLGDFFTYHGIIAATEDNLGVPALETLMHQGLVSRAGFRVAVVLDDSYPDGAYLTLTLS